MSSTAPFQPAGGPPAANPDLQFDHERFDCYRVALEFQGSCRGCSPSRVRGVARSVDRASASVLLNIAEGCAYESRVSKAQFFTIARGSDGERGRSRRPAARA
jgi:hypothetical protein